jgi:hypothetical protein
MLATTQQKLLTMDWARKIHTLEYAHRFESREKEGLSSKLGNWAMAISAIVAGLSLASFPIANGSWLKVVGNVGSVLGSIIVAILSGIQTNAKPSEVAEKHRQSSSSYEELRHRVELLLVNTGLTSDYVMAQLPIIERDFEKLRQHTPNVSDNNFKEAKKTVTNLGTYPTAMRFEQSP